MFERIHLRLQDWLADYSTSILRRALGLIFLWFGLLKFCPGLCDMEPIAQHTVTVLSLDRLQPDICFQVLAALETAIGAILFFAPSDQRWGRQLLRAAALLMCLHLVGTFLPLMLFRHETWKIFPIAPTLAGQYILKNIVLMAAALAVYGQAVPHARRARLAVLRERSGSLRFMR